MLRRAGTEVRRYCSSCNATIEDSAQERCPACNSARPEWNWPRDARIGEVVVGGQYRIVRRLGAGGFGTVYEVETIVGGLRRALKVLGKEWLADETVRERFVNEAIVLGQVSHPNIARCYAVGAMENGEELYMLLELVEGEQLTKLVHPNNSDAVRPMSPRRATKIAKQIASGLAAAHDAEVIHRDVKPENVLVTDPNGPDEQAKLLDFGIAKLMEQGATSTKTVVGTPQFMAPEQFSPGEQLDGRLDLWQLGATLFFMLTGRPPYLLEDGSHVLTLLDQHDKNLEAGPSPSEIVPALAEHGELDALVRRLLATNAENRPDSAAEVCEDLARIEHSLATGSSMTGAVALLEALCAEPNEGAWWALCRYLGGRDEEQSSLLRGAERRLESWSDELRRVPSSWWESTRKGEPHQLWALGRSLDLSGRDIDDAGLERLVGSSAFASITRVSLANNNITSKGVLALATSPNVGRLVHMDLSGNSIGASGAEELAASANLTNLRSLAIDGGGIGARGATAIAESRLQLEQLSLANNRIGKDGAADLARSEALAGLLDLSLAGNEIGPDGAASMSTSRTLVNLRALDLSNNAMGASGAAALALSTNLASLRSLNLSENGLGLQGLELLAHSGKTDNLEALDISSNGFGSRGAMVLGSSSFSRRLVSLNVSDNDLGDAGLVALLNGPQLSTLHVLDVAQNGLTAAGTKLLAAAPPQLSRLDISRNELGSDGAQALGEALPSLRIQSLAVGGTGLGAEGLTEVLRAGGGRLTELVADAAGVGVDGARMLARASELAAVRVLDLSKNELGSRGVAAVAASPHLTNLRHLALDGNAIGDDGIASLVAVAEGMPLLERLSLSDNALGRRGAEALAGSAFAARLAFLDLSFNELEDAGAEALARGESFRNLHELRLERNGIGLGGTSALLSSPNLHHVCRFELRHNVVRGEADMHTLAPNKVDLLESSFAALASQGATIVEKFYDLLFARFPPLKPLFANTTRAKQQQHLLQALILVIDNVRSPDTVEQVLSELALRHVDYGVSPSQYYAVSSTLLEVLEIAAGDLWSDELRDAWSDGLDAITSVMLNAHVQATRRPRP